MECKVCYDRKSKCYWNSEEGVIILVKKGRMRKPTEEGIFELGLKGWIES